MKYKNLMAKALYDNVPESPEELAFRKGDILTVIEQNTGGLEGWWLCSLHGRQGIAPGNRLKLLIGPMFENQTASSPAPSQSHAHQPRPHTPQGLYQPGPAPAQGIYQVPPSQDLYQVPPSQDVYQVPPSQDVYQVPPSQDVYQVPQRSALAADAMPNKVLTPTRVGQTYAYSPAPNNNSHDLYDVPPVRQQGVYDIPPGKQTGKQKSPHSQGLYDIPPTADTRNQGVYDIPPASQGVYSIPPCRSNAAPDEGNYDFPQPHKPKAKPEGVYDIPPSFSISKSSQSSQSNYDFPPSSEQRMLASSDGSVYDIPASQPASAGNRDLYDVPQGVHVQARDRNKGIYDIPPTDPRLPQDITDGMNRLSFSSSGSTRSSMSTSSSSAGSPAEGRLALDLDSALQRIGRLQQGLDSSVSALQSFATSPNWRTYGFMERHSNEVRLILERVRGALAEILAFGRGAAANASALSDSGLHLKLRRQLQRLEDSQQILQQTHQSLENSGWCLNVLVAGGRQQRQQQQQQQQGKSDELDRFVMVARTVPDDAKQLASTIAGSAELLFRRTPVEGVVHPFTCSPAEEDNNHSNHHSCQTKPFPVPQDSEKCVKSWMEDYDYVHLQGKDEFERQQKELLDKENIMKQSKVQLEQEQLNQFKQLEQEVIKPVENDITQWISHHHHSTGSTGSASSPSDSSSSTTTTSSSCVGGVSPVCGRDRQLLGFYAEQCEQHFVTLLNAVDAFFGCVAAGQPPRIFVAHAKFVILSAHKLVFIGDTLSRQAAAPDVANRVMDSSNVLCQMLKTVVGATKMAALQYPSTGAVQEMVDRVTDLSHRAQQFKAQLLHMAAAAL